MTRVRIPQTMQVYTGKRAVVEVSGRNVRQLVAELERLYPGMQQALLAGDRLKPDVALMLDGRMSQLGLLQPVSDENEVVFLPAISGG